MKNPKRLAAVVGRAKVGPSRHADTELDHLETVVRLMARDDTYTPIHGLDMAYWRSRVALIVSAAASISRKTDGLKLTMAR
jgi:hypothetical protein